MIINNIKRWNYFARPLPKNVKWVSGYEKGKYNLAVLDIDQQCVDPRIGKGQLYRMLDKAIDDIPKIVINHGTPCWPENWESTGHKRWNLPLGMDENDRKKVLEYQKKFLINGGKTIINQELVEIEGMEKLIGKNKMVVNSFNAREQWGWGKVIWHGLDPNDWLDLPKEPRSVTMISTGGLDYYYGRDFLNSTIQRLKEDFGLNHVWLSHPGSWTIYDSDSLPEKGGFYAYKEYLGRSAIYFNPTRESPMPRSRTEAMLSGCCVLTTPYHDADKFINFDTREIWSNSEGVVDYLTRVDELINTDGINGIIIPENPLAVASLINYLIYDNYSVCHKIGQEGKKTALKLFSKTKYDQKWQDLLQEIIKKGVK